MLMASDRNPQLTMKLAGHWRSGGTRPAVPGCKFIGMQRLRLYRSNRKNNGKIRSASGMRCKNFAQPGKRMLEQDFGNGATIFKTWKSSKICFESIFGIFWLGGWIRRLLRTHRRERFVT